MQLIYSRLNQLHKDLVEKTGEQPYLTPRLTVDPAGYCRIDLYAEGHERLFNARTPSIEETLESAEDFVRNMPELRARTISLWHKKLGEVIDEGHDLALPDEVMQPLRAGSQAMTENLLT
jgi:hypothetical protein